VPRSIDELIAHADEIADDFERYEPREPQAGGPALMALRRAADRRSTVEREVLDSVRQARDEGASRAAIGAELGTTGVPARQRYGDRLEV